LPDAGVDAGPAFGLLARPRNDTCKAPATTAAIATTLTATGCMDPADPRKPAPGLIPYTVASPLWSDGSDKERFFALPEGAKIKVKDCQTTPALCDLSADGGTPEDDGDLDFPVGTVLVKSFGFAGKVHETRLLIRFRADLWKGYSYRWRADQKEADLLPDDVGGLRADVQNAAGATQSWHYPDRAQCMQCHTDASGVILGPELRQLNTDYRYPSGVTSNQLQTLEHIGVFESALRKPLPVPLPLPTANAGTVADRARSYLHANCAICHRPRGNFEQLDLRYGVPLAQMKICNANPEKGDLGVAGAKRLVPGEPAKSVLTLRMHKLDMTRMPQIGTNVIDEGGVAAVEAWIRGLTTCN
jgi:uncharacterized repeat protein (TIGR03806 family)